MTESTMVRVRRTTVERLNAKKIVRNETHDEVIVRALDALEQRQAAARQRVEAAVGKSA